MDPSGEIGLILESKKFCLVVSEWSVGYYVGFFGLSSSLCE